MTRRPWRADAPAGPIYLRFTRESGHFFRPYWSVNGATWNVIGDPAKPPAWINPGKDQLVAGPVITTNAVPQSFQYYTVKAPVLTDATGNAIIPLDTTERSGPVGSGPTHPAISAGAAIDHLDYVPRYEGFCNLALWMTRPRIVREFAWGDYDRVVEKHWQALMRATDRVWNDPVLTRFWRKGKLLANPAYAEQSKNHHPMNGIGEFWGKRWAGLDCFFQLSVAINPPFAQWPVGNNVTRTSTDQPGAVIKVWAIAYELGTKPKREWLLITQSPREDRKACRLPCQASVTQPSMSGAAAASTCSAKASKPRFRSAIPDAPQQHPGHRIHPSTIMRHRLASFIAPLALGALCAGEPQTPATPPAAAEITSAAWLKTQPKPAFRAGHTLPRLTRYAWSLPFDTASS